MEAKKQFICYWRHILNINGNIIRLTNKNQWHIFDLQIETVMTLHTKTRYTLNWQKLYKKSKYLVLITWKFSWHVNFANLVVQKNRKI